MAQHGAPLRGTPVFFACSHESCAQLSPIARQLGATVLSEDRMANNPRVVVISQDFSTMALEVLQLLMQTS